MPDHRRIRLHGRGPALWPEHKPEEEVLDLRATTAEPVWFATYQGSPVPPGGYIFRRDWFRERYDIDDPGVRNRVYARFLSFDTAQKTEDRHDYSALVVGELWPDYRLGIRFVDRRRLEFPELVDWIETAAGRWNRDEKLHAIIVEDKMSGTSALQTMRASSSDLVRRLLVPFVPTTDKVTRANQAAVWARLRSVILPYVREDLYWLIDFQEEELFLFPQVDHDDRIDAFDQLVLYLENMLSAGYEARKREQPEATK